MAKPIHSEFTQYKWESDAEEKQAAILSEANIFNIRNQLAMAMHERANLDYDPALPITVFVQQEAALKGQINAYKFLLDLHDSTIRDLSSSEDSTLSNN